LAEEEQVPWTSSVISLILLVTKLMVEFDQLDESLQDTFAAFLAERGVDESLCEFHAVN
jgi:hypothetical protein